MTKNLKLHNIPTLKIVDLFLELNTFSDLEDYWIMKNGQC
jgi:hypothetical protein